MLTVLGVPLSMILIFFMFGRHILFARLDTWLRVMLILWPVCMLFAHNSHFAMLNTSFIAR